MDQFPQERPSLLIVDDLADNRVILSRRFERRGFEVFEADGGTNALAAISRRSFDLVLLDVMMPDIDGIEVLKRIREEHSQTSLPVIMVTARSQSEDVVEALEFGANDYVTKPVDFAVALARVNAQIERRRAEQRVRSANDELLRANATLEERIAEHTANLQQANENLQSEIASRRESEDTIRYLAYHDPLTGLRNRVSFREILADAVRTSSEELAVLHLDLDDFRIVNDTLGHEAGDVLLKQVCDRIIGEIEETTTLARLGGDEFALIQTEGPQPERANKLADRLVGLLGMPFDVDGQQAAIGASCGIAFASEDALDPDQLIKMADIATSAAKSDGKKGFRTYDPAMRLEAESRRKIEIDMRRAIRQGEFELHFQPLISLVDNSIASFEALLRWPCKGSGGISPDEFIPIAEETGLIIPLGEWALREACSQATQWPEDIRVAVNLSPAQFKSDKLIPTVVYSLAASGLEASRLELEITESVLLEATERNLEVLHGLREIGVRISMDDFGTGYSSMGYLQSFAFDKIKIDRSFIRALNERGNSLAIIQAISGLSSSIGITTTAEGVESEEQLEALKREGCTEIQGYIFSAPMPARDVPAFIAEYGRET